MAVRNTALLPQISVHGTRSLHSEIAEKILEDVPQGHNANIATSASPNMSVKNFTKSTYPNKSSSDEDNCPGVLLCMVIISGLAIFIYCQGRKDGAQNLMAQLPDCKFFTEREALRKEQERLKPIEGDLIIFWNDGLRKRIKELAEKFETLDRKEIEHLRQRAMVLEKNLKTHSLSADDHAAKHEMGKIRRTKKKLKES